MLGDKDTNFQPTWGQGTFGCFDIWWSDMSPILIILN